MKSHFIYLYNELIHFITIINLDLLLKFYLYLNNYFFYKL